MPNPLETLSPGIGTSSDRRLKDNLRLRDVLMTGS
jgi:hypothetical protein